MTTSERIVVAVAKAIWPGDMRLYRDDCLHDARYVLKRLRKAGVVVHLDEGECYAAPPTSPSTEPPEE